MAFALVVVVAYTAGWFFGWLTCGMLCRPLGAQEQLARQPELARMLESFRVRGTFAFVTLTEAQDFADALERAAGGEVD
jgi:hypothetical protein